MAPLNPLFWVSTATVQSTNNCLESGAHPLRGWDAYAKIGVERILMWSSVFNTFHPDFRPNKVVCGAKSRWNWNCFVDTQIKWTNSVSFAFYLSPFAFQTRPNVGDGAPGYVWNYPSSNTTGISQKKRGGGKELQNNFEYQKPRDWLQLMTI